MTTRLSSIAVAALVAAAVPWAPPPAAAEVHPFYEQRLTAGVLALSQGRAAAAASDLRIAAFGLLDEPARLAVALTHLAVAERAAGDEEGLDRTLQRLLGVEQRFAVWGAAEVPAETRAAVVALLVERVPEVTLAAVPAFRQIAEQRTAERIAALPPAERRRELLARVTAQPDVPRWQLMLGELELAAGDNANAVARAQRALAAQPSGSDETAARCLRGAALAGSGSCAAAVADLEVCPASRRDAELAHALLECHAQLAQWRQAKAVADVLPPAVRSRRDVGRLVRRVEREAAKLPAAAAPAPPEAAQAPPTPSPAASAALPAADRQRLARARELMGAASRAADLEEPLAIATAVAETHPDAVEAQHLVGEIAYRASRWELAATYLRRGGPSAERPELMFYLAVALWESGERDEAAKVMEAVLPRLQRTAFIDDYARRILGRQAAP